MPQCRCRAGPRTAEQGLMIVADTGPVLASALPYLNPTHEDRDLQRQRHQRPPAASARWLEEHSPTRLPAGAEDARREVSRRCARATPATARSGTARKLQRRRHPRARRRAVGAAARPARRPRRTHSRYIEAAVARRLVGSPLPAQRQPAAGPEVRLQARLVRAADASMPPACSPNGARSCWPATTTSCPPTVGHLLRRARGKDDALLQPESRDAFRRLLDQGWTDAIRHLHPSEPIYTFWDYFRNAWQRDAGLRIDHLLLNATAQGPPRAGRGRPRGAGAGKDERPRAGLDLLSD